MDPIATVEQLRRLAGRLSDAQEAERVKLARQLHDQLGQSLTILKRNCAWLAERMADAPPDAAEKLQDILRLADEALRTGRQVSSDLRPGILDLGIGAAIEWKAEAFEACAGIRCSVDLCDDDTVIDTPTATQLFRIFQEILANILRHTEATQVRIELRCTASQVTLEVHDDGRGIPEAKVNHPDSLGILDMRERAARIGGTLTIHGSSGAGTTVTVRVPVHPAPPL